MLIYVYNTLCLCLLFSDMLNVHVRHLIKTVRLEFNHKIFCEPAALSALMSGLSSLCTTQSHEELYTSTVRYIVQNIVLYKDKFPNNYLKTFLKFVRYKGLLLLFY